MSDTQITELFFQQGKIARINGDYDRAIALFQRALQEQPDYADAHMELGLAYCFSGLFDESIQELEHAVKLDGRNPEIYLNLAKTYTMLGMYEQGSAAFKAVMALSQVGDKFYAEAEKQLSYFSQMF